MAKAGEDFPLDTTQQAEIVTDAITEEAISLWAIGVDFVAMTAGSEFYDRWISLTTPELFEATPERREKLARVLAMADSRVEELIASGQAEDEAIRIVQGEMIKAAVQSHILKNNL